MVLIWENVTERLDISSYIDLNVLYRAEWNKMIFFIINIAAPVTSIHLSLAVATYYQGQR